MPWDNIQSPSGEQNLVFHRTQVNNYKLSVVQESDKGRTLEENMEKLEEERSKSNELLYRMMPQPVADRLKKGEKAINTCEVHHL